MDSGRKKPTDRITQPWIVVWRALGRQGITASHEGTCARSAEEALDDVEEMLAGTGQVVSTYNEGQCRRIHDLLTRANRCAPAGKTAYVVFYDLLLNEWGSRPTSDRTQEGWIVVLAGRDDEPITVAYDLLDTRCTAFLSYDADDMEEIAWALSASWPES